MLLHYPGKRKLFLLLQIVQQHSQWVHMDLQHFKRWLRSRLNRPTWSCSVLPRTGLYLAQELQSGPTSHSRPTCSHSKQPPILPLPWSASFHLFPTDLCSGWAQLACTYLSMPLWRLDLVSEVWHISMHQDIFSPTRCKHSWHKELVLIQEHTKDCCRRVYCYAKIYTNDRILSALIPWSLEFHHI